MRFVLFGFNLLFVLLMVKDALLFPLAARHPKKAQERLLQDILRLNKHTAFGQRHFFANIRSRRNFMANVPLQDYESLKPDILRMADGEKAILTHEDVLLFEPTSGSTSASKWIPYTKSLKQQFQKGIAPWIVSLYAKAPKLLFGSSYWSVTPLTEGVTRTPGGIPVGFEEDGEYFGTFGQQLLDRMMAVPSAVKHIGHMESFRYVTLLFLLKRRDLALVSVWNPTYWLLLADDLETYWDALLQDLRDGKIRPPAPLPEGIGQRLTALLGKQPKRAEELARLSPQAYGDIWPDLHVISAWADAQAKPYAEELAARFPRVWVQPKGLLSTECFVSFPLGSSGAVVSPLSHVYEFLPMEDGAGDEIKLLHELEIGRRYEVTVTTGGGLYRYRTKDVVEVTGFYRRTPIVRFAGRNDRVTDHFGEKLNEQHVADALQEVFAQHGLRTRFAMVALEKQGNAAFYTLFWEGAADRTSADPPPPAWQTLADSLDEKLRANFHYAYCQKLSQLRPLRLYLIDKGGLESYMAHCVTLGQKLGNIKPCTLHKGTGWSQVFSGKFAE